MRTNACRIALVAALSAGCPFIVGGPDLSNVDQQRPGGGGGPRLGGVDTGSPPPVEEDATADTAPADLPWDWCAEGALEGDPAVASGSTTGGEDRFTPSCAPSAAPDAALLFTAPVAGTYRISTGGSGFNTVLAVYDGCDGAEIACNDDAIASLSRVLVDLDEGETVVVVVDGFGVATGSWALDVRWIPPEDCANHLDDDFDSTIDCLDSDCVADAACDATCPEEVLQDVLVGNTIGRTDDVSPPCTYSIASDVTVSFTAPLAGSYVFDTSGSSYDTVLFAAEGCGGGILACNDDWFGLQSRVVLNLTEGQTAVLVVDGYGAYAGDYTLRVRYEQACADGVDDDGDGALDCADLECAGDPACALDP